MREPDFPSEVYMNMCNIINTDIATMKVVQGKGYHTTDAWHFFWAHRLLRLCPRYTRLYKHHCRCIMDECLRGRNEDASLKTRKPEYTKENMWDYSDEPLVLVQNLVKRIDNVERYFDDIRKRCPDLQDFMYRLN